jgi:FMN phosphatase YigB (HAD superfamily)
MTSYDVDFEIRSLYSRLASVSETPTEKRMSNTMHTIRAVLLDCGDTLIDEATEVKDEHHVSRCADLIPGAAELVRALKRRGYPLALVADGPEGTFVNNLAPHGIYDLFDAYAISDCVGVEKPDASIFRHALDVLDVLPKDYARVVMVGNHLERDITGANALGIISVWLDWSPRRAKSPADQSEVPQHIIKKPLDLLALLDRLERTFRADQLTT